MHCSVNAKEDKNITTQYFMVATKKKDSKPVAKKATAKTTAKAPKKADNGVAKTGKKIVKTIKKQVSNGNALNMLCKVLSAIS